MFAVDDRHVAFCNFRGGVAKIVCVTLATLAKGSTGLAIYSWTVEHIGRDIFPLMTITLNMNY